MGLIKSYAELEAPTSVKMMLYGQAGMGKTTLALSSSRPLLLDFDGGVQRVNIEHLKTVDTVQVDSWATAQAVLQEDLTKYDTIVIDTVGKMCDVVQASVCGLRQPQLRDWGKINSEAVGYIKAIQSLGKNLVFVAHRAERRNGDELQYIPQIRDKVYNSIVSELDLLGYVEALTENGRTQRSITFDPTTKSEGKNTCNLPSVMIIPELVDRQGNTLGANTMISEQVVQPYLAMVKHKTELARQHEALVSKAGQEITAISDPEELGAYLDMVQDKDYPHIGSSLVAIKRLVNERSKALGLKYNQATKAFEYADSTSATA